MDGKVVTTKVMLAREGTLAAFTFKFLDADRVVSFKMRFHVVLAAKLLASLRAGVPLLFLVMARLETIHGRRQ